LQPKAAFFYSRVEQNRFISDFFPVRSRKSPQPPDIFRKKNFLPLFVAKNPRVMNPDFLSHSPKRNPFFIAQILDYCPQRSTPPFSIKVAFLYSVLGEALKSSSTMFPGGLVPRVFPVDGTRLSA
jgi:hypothetical protein